MDQSAVFIHKAVVVCNAIPRHSTRHPEAKPLECKTAAHNRRSSRRHGVDTQQTVKSPQTVNVSLTQLTESDRERSQPTKRVEHSKPQTHTNALRGGCTPHPQNNDDDDERQQTNKRTNERTNDNKRTNEQRTNERTNERQQTNNERTTNERTNERTNNDQDNALTVSH